LNSTVGKFLTLKIAMLCAKYAFKVVKADGITSIGVRMNSVYFVILNFLNYDKALGCYGRLPIIKKLLVFAIRWLNRWK